MGSLAVNRFDRRIAPRLRQGGSHFMMLYQLGDAPLRNSIANFANSALGAIRFPPANKLDPKSAIEMIATA
jgi:hypothetical protein